jgi:DNA polymerase III delta' subunit
MFLPLVPGQELAKQYFRRAIDLGRLSHAYLFLGPEGTGKKLFARELAKALLCASGTPCGACPSCLQIDHGNHPSVNFYGPADGKSLIDIDTARAFCERTHYRSSQLQVDVIEEAHCLNEPAANALLKTLEEPPEKVILILTAQSSGSLLPTIVSRCHRIPFVRPKSPSLLLSPEQRALLSEVTLPGFFARGEPREWLERISPDPGGVRGSLRRLLDSLVEEWRGRFSSSSLSELDSLLLATEAFLELRQDLDHNVHPDLVLERLLRTLLERSPALV